VYLKHFTLEQLKGFELTFKLLKKEPILKSILLFVIILIKNGKKHFLGTKIKNRTTRIKYTYTKLLKDGMILSNIH
jgi:hypothetical protein